NNTYSGYGNNQELFYKFNYSVKETKNLSIFRQVFLYILELQKTSILMQVSGIRLDAIQKGAEWLTGPINNGDELLINNNSLPIIDQIFSNLPDDINEIILIAPFWGANLDIVKNISKKFPDAMIKIVIKSGDSNFPRDYYYNNKKLFKNTKVHEFISSKDNNRYLHAKALIFKNDKREYLFSGSPNISTAALGLTIKKGNAEAGIFVNDLLGGEITQLFKKCFSEREINPVSFVFNSIKHDSEEENIIYDKKLISITDAYIENNKLHLHFFSTYRGDAKVFVNDCDIYNFLISSENQVVVDMFIVKKKTGDLQCFYVQMQTINGNSNTVWIGDVNLKKAVGTEKFTKALNQISQVFTNMDRFCALVEFTSHLEVKREKRDSLSEGVKLIEEEFGEEEVEMASEEFFVEERNIFNDNYEEFKNNIESNPDNLFNLFIRGLSKSLSGSQDIKKLSKDTILDKVDKGVGSVNISSEGDSEEEIFYSFNKIIARAVSRITRDGRSLNSSDVAVTNQLLGVLIWFYQGEKVDYRGQYINVKLTDEIFFDYTFQLLKRVWSYTAASDFLMKGFKEDELEIYNMIGVYSVTLCVLAYVFWIINFKNKNLSNDFNKKFKGIFVSYINEVRDIPDNFVGKIFFQDKIDNIIRQVICDDEFSLKLNVEDLINASKTISRTDLINEINLPEIVSKFFCS
ncbi:MAG: hypothetical protein Q8N57_01065, partial [bacterium]|nr:hypothetical protein [bacterium]